jgi:hypothetical protein
MGRHPIHQANVLQMLKHNTKQAQSTRLMFFKCQNIVDTFYINNKNNKILPMGGVFIICCHLKNKPGGFSISSPMFFVINYRLIWLLKILFINLILILLAHWNESCVLPNQVSNPRSTALERSTLTITPSPHLRRAC